MDMDSNSAVAMIGRCRVCLEKDVDVVALSLTVCLFAGEITLSQILKTCCAIEISSSDLKPQTLCNHCAKTAQQSFIFRTTCQKAEITLQEELARHGDNIKFEQDEVNFKVESNELIIKEEHEEDDHKDGTMEAIKYEFPDSISISNVDGLTQNSISLEHHLEDSYRCVCGVCGQAFTTEDTFKKHALTHEIPSTDQKVILIQREKSKWHKCRFCKMSYKYPAELRYHLMTHRSLKHYLCLYCGKNFSLFHRSICKRTHTRHGRIHLDQKSAIKANESSQTLQHFDCGFKLRACTPASTHTDAKAYECSHCSKCFTQKSQLTAHERSHTGAKPYECSHCSKRFTQKSQLTIHERSHTGEKPWECLHCSKCFTRLDHLNEHKLTHTGDRPFECLDCRKRFAKQGQLTVHKRIHTGEKPYECSYCSKRFSEKNGLIMHKRIHTGEKPYQCLDCSQHFTTRSNLNSHKRNHTGEKPFECLDCSKRFAQLSHLTVHNRIHTGEKPYECSQCSKRFADKSSHTIHIRIHSNEKPYECSDCSKRFTTQRYLTKHKRIHTGEKPYECSECSQLFTARSSLNKHKLIHTRDKLYECSHCSERYTHQADLIRHICIHVGEVRQ